MLEKLRKKNPDMKFYSVYDTEFDSYGRVIKDFDVTEIVAAAKTIENPSEGSAYVPSEPKFEVLETAKKITDSLFGEMPTQVGYCWGYNTTLNATEWHTASEINIAITDIVLILGHVWDIKDGFVDSADMKAFYVPAGTAIEAYATSLHYCPCQTSDSGFGCVVGLPKGTNTQLDKEHEGKLLWAKNKWLLAHKDNTELLEKGAVAGITGENYTVKY